MSQLISVTVHLHTILQRQTPQGPLARLEVQIPAGSTVGDLMQVLEIRMDVQDLLLVANGRLAQAGQVLGSGDEIHFIPAISGGASGGLDNVRASLFPPEA